MIDEKMERLSNALDRFQWERFLGPYVQITELQV
jgi:hypothetical protein